MKIILRFLILLLLILSINCHHTKIKTKSVVLTMPPNTVLPSTANYGTCMTGKYYSEREPTLNSWLNF